MEASLHGYPPDLLAGGRITDSFLQLGFGARPVGGFGCECDIPCTLLSDMQIANERLHLAARCMTYCNPTSGDCETLCTDNGYPSLSETSAFHNMIATFLLLVFNCFTRLMKILDRPSRWVTYNLRIPLSRWWRKRILLADPAFLRSPKGWIPNHILIRKYFLVKQALAVLLLSRLYADPYASTLSEVSSRPSPPAVITVY